MWALLSSKLKSANEEGFTFGASYPAKEECRLARQVLFPPPRAVAGLSLTAALPPQTKAMQQFDPIA
jgi:hypothetical protein